MRRSLSVTVALVLAVSGLGSARAYCFVAGDDEPTPGGYLFRYEYSLDGAPPVSDLGYKVVGGITETARGLRFSVDDQVTGISYRFLIVRFAREDGSGEFAPGLYITDIAIPKKDGNGSVRFSPQPALALVRYPIEPDASTTSAAVSTVLEPSIAGLPHPKVSLVTLDAIVGGREAVRGGECYTDAWRATIDLRGRGDFPFMLTGAFGLWQYQGGWFIQDDFTISSDTLISGQFSAHIEDLNPA